MIGARNAAAVRFSFLDASYDRTPLFVSLHCNKDTWSLERDEAKSRIRCYTPCYVAKPMKMLLA